MIEDVIAYFAIGGSLLGLLGWLIERDVLVRLGGLSLFLAGVAMIAPPTVLDADYALPSWLTPIVAVGAILCGMMWMLTDPSRWFEGAEGGA